MRTRQHTLAKPAMVEGTGLHSGAPSRMVIKPAPVNHGLRFISVDHRGEPLGRAIAATAGNVIDTELGTSIAGADGARVRTIEHFMAAAVLASLDNAEIEVHGAELPILDGSAAPFLTAMVNAGFTTQAADRSALRITRRFSIADGQRSIEASPFDGRLLEVAIKFDDPAIGAQSVMIDLDDQTAIARLAKARTFCRKEDIAAMRGRGLGLGGSLDNALVVDGGRIVNEGGLRDPQEFALHKLLDLIGDLALAGAPILGRIRAVRPGHDFNIRFVKGLEGPDAPVERTALRPVVAPV